MKNSKRSTARNLLGQTNPSQTRTDSWQRLLEVSGRLAALKNTGGGAADSLRETLAAHFDNLKELERFWAYPGSKAVARLLEHFENRRYALLAEELSPLVRGMKAYSGRTMFDADAIDAEGQPEPGRPRAEQRSFTVLFVEDSSSTSMDAVNKQLREMADPTDEFVYDVVAVSTLEDALTAAMYNHGIQACVVSYDFPLTASPDVALPAELAEMYDENAPHGLLLGEVLADARPELDLYLLNDVALEDMNTEPYDVFRRVFYRLEDLHELHATMIEGVATRYKTPFFDALKRYAEKPIGNFHALPIARGSSIFNSRWIQDMGEFYGANIFLAESSSTSGGLDSLLAPTGPIREAQEAASRAFGSKQTYFVTNGTSTSNKIVCQALLEPGDIVLIDRNCHKSHHYGMVLSDAHPVYLDAYPLESYAIYGAVPLRTIKKQMLDLKKAGRLDRVKMVLLTNCTFDGLVYNPQLVMEELLAIKPDLCFLWDEAWFAYACMSPIIRQRTAMYSARELYERYRSEEYRAEYEAFKTEFDAKDADDPDTWLNTRLMPDPDHVRIRVYATHSTHKSLSALRQGSMLHHWDQDFARKTEDAFHEAFFTHTSTSPNYQVLASLDIARRQVELEGYGMLSGTQHMAFAVRDRINSDPLLSKYFKILTPGELIPEEFRPSGLKAYSAADGDEEELLSATIEAWENDEFVIDPTRMTLLTANSGINGDEFKYDVLMERFGIQVNKTSLNSVLFIATIGVTWGGVSYLLGALRQVAKEIESRLDGASSAELLLHDRRIGVLTQDLPPLPDFSYFHSVFRPNQTSQEGAMRAAYFLNYSEENREYIPLDEAEKLVSEGRELVATTFIIPYPPGFPVLVPGQVVSPEILEFMQKLAIKEVHGYRAELGLPIFKQAALDSLAS